MVTDRELMEVIRDFRASEWVAITLVDEELEVRLVKRAPGSAIVETRAPSPAPVASVEPAADDERAHADVDDTPAPDATSADDGTVVPSPTIGIFWEAPAPGAEPFVRVGDRVEAGAQVAIVEVMKLMTDVVVRSAGTIEEVLAENGQTVEAGQALFRIRYDDAAEA